MENKNIIEKITRTEVSKAEIIDLIKKTFPEEEVGYNGKIAYIVTTEMTDGTKMQSICFGKPLNV